MYQQISAVDVTFTPAQDTDGNKVPVSVGGFLLHLIQSPDRHLRKHAWESLATGMAATRLRWGLRLPPQSGAMPRSLGCDGMIPFWTCICPSCKYLRQSITMCWTICTLTLSRMCAGCYVCASRYWGRAPCTFSIFWRRWTLGYRPVFSIEEAERQILAALSPLGGEYSDVIATAFRERWVDWADNVGKTDIPMSVWAYDVHPYIATAWHGGLYDVSVLAHELGHVVHATFPAGTRSLAIASQESSYSKCPAR